MKILFLIDSLGSGGAQRQMTTIACLLKAKGYNVEFLVYSKSNFFKPKVESAQITINYIIEERMIFRILKIRHFIRRNNYNTVISFMDTPNFINCFSAVGSKKWKVITSERSSNEQIFKRLKNRIFNWFQRYADVIICNSYNAKHMWQKHIPDYGEKVKVIYNTVTLNNDLGSYNPVRNGRINLVVAASYQKLKNPILLIEAISLLSDEEKRKLHIEWFGNQSVSAVGDGIYQTAKSLISEYGLADIISLNGEERNIHKTMQESDIVGLFSDYEGLPNVICEALTIGKPVVMTKVSDYDVFIDSCNGILCDEISSHGIAKALKEIVKLTSTELESMGIYSKNKSIDLFSNDVIIKKWENEIIS